MPATSVAAKEPVQVPTEADADGDADSKVSTPSLEGTGGYVPSMGNTGKRLVSISLFFAFISAPATYLLYCTCV